MSQQPVLQLRDCENEDKVEEQFDIGDRTVIGFIAAAKQMMAAHTARVRIKTALLQHLPHRAFPK